MKKRKRKINVISNVDDILLIMTSQSKKLLSILKLNSMICPFVFVVIVVSMTMI